MAAVEEVTNQLTNLNVNAESITCYVKVLPPFIKSWKDFIIHIAPNCFPEEILPITVDKKTNKFVLDKGQVVIKESESTLQFVELKTYNFNGKIKYSIVFKIPRPNKTDSYYNYLMDNVFDPLLNPEPTDDGKIPMVELSWEDYKGKEFWIKLSLYHMGKQLQIPNQDRFRQERNKK